MASPTANKPILVANGVPKLHLINNTTGDEVMMNGGTYNNDKKLTNGNYGNKTNGYTGDKEHLNGSMTEVDPEMEAEKDYAREHPQEKSAPVALPMPSAGDLELSPPKTGPAMVRRGKSIEDQVLLNGVISVGRDLKNQRKSRAGRGRGNAKKEGGGGKYTWGPAGQLYEELEVDPNDPNYDSDAQANLTFEEVEVTSDLIDKYVEPMVLEFYLNGDLREAVDSIKELSLSREARSAVVELVVALALDHNGDARELSSELLAELVHRRVLTQSDVAKGFTMLLNHALPDLVLDYPMAGELVGNFMARALADLAMPADFLEVLSKTKDNSVSNPHATESLERAEVLIKHKEQLHDIWGVGGGRKPVRFLSKEMMTILKEFLASGDEKEASRCLRELEVPHFNHEFVYQAGVMAVEGMHERSVRLLATLLQHLTESGELTPTAIEKGFDRLYANLSDLSIDVPPAYALAEWWTKASRDSGFLPKHIGDRLPRKGRKRFVSEGNDGKLCVSDIPNPYI